MLAQSVKFTTFFAGYESLVADFELGGHVMVGHVVLGHVVIDHVVVDHAVGSYAL